MTRPAWSRLAIPSVGVSEPYCQLVRPVGERIAAPYPVMQHIPRITHAHYDSAPASLGHFGRRKKKIAAQLCYAVHHTRGVLLCTEQNKHRAATGEPALHGSPSLACSYSLGHTHTHTQRLHVCVSPSLSSRQTIASRCWLRADLHPAAIRQLLASRRVVHGFGTRQALQVMALLGRRRASQPSCALLVLVSSIEMIKDCRFNKAVSGLPRSGALWLGFDAARVLHSASCPSVPGPVRQSATRERNPGMTYQYAVHESGGSQTWRLIVEKPVERTKIAV